MKMPTTPTTSLATDPIAAAGNAARSADAAGPTNPVGLGPPLVRAAANVVVPPTNVDVLPPVVTADPPPVGAAAGAAKMAGLNRLGPEVDAATGAEDGTTPAVLTEGVRTGDEPPVGAAVALELPPGVAGTAPLAFANNVFGVASAARLGPVGIETCLTDDGEINASSPGAAVPLTAKTPAATAAVIPVLFLAIVIARFLSQEGSPRTVDRLYAMPV
jgi:hypothetical protein